MDSTLKYCKELVQDFADMLHLSYQELNVWVFVIILPIVFLLLLAIIGRQKWIIKSLKHTLSSRK